MSVDFSLGTQVMRPVAQHQSEHLWLDRDFDSIMANPTIPQGIKDEMWRKMQSDSLRAPSSRVPAIQPLAMAAGASLAAPALFVPLDLLKPAKLREGKFEVFGDGREVRVGEFSVDKPFAIAKDVLEKSKHQAAKSHLAKAPVAISLPAPPDPDDFDPDEPGKEQEPQRNLKEKFNECEKSESPMWKSLQPHKGKTKTNGLSGKDKRYYEWDDLHKEIEMYDRHGKPIDALDPVSGKMKGKNVSGHRPLKNL